MKYRKKPVEIEAFHYREVPYIDWPIWAKTAIGKKWEPGAINCMYDLLAVYTLEGPVIAGSEDWIIKGTKGELYPCKPDIFDAIYEPVED